MMYGSTSQQIRPSVVDGMFYPAQATTKALVVPHAGYIYSGQLASDALNSLRPRATKIKRVVLLGPVHRLAFEGIANSNYKLYATPLGSIPLDCQLPQPEQFLRNLKRKAGLSEDYWSNDMKVSRYETVEIKQEQSC